MGLVAVSAGGTGSGETVIATLSAVGPGIGGIFISVTLIYLFAYLTLFDAAEVDRPGLRNLLVSFTVSLFVAFVAIQLHWSLQFV